MSRAIAHRGPDEDKALEFENLAIPTEDLDNGQTINGVWYNVYDLDKAAKVIEEFILED